MKMIEEVDIEKVIPYENNPRDNENAVEYVANSIREFGFKSPIIVDKNYVIIAGHTRLKASIKLGLKTVPVVVADDLTEEQVKAYRLADNKVAEFAGWDNEKLNKELDELFGIIDMNDFGFPVQIEDITEEIEEPEENFAKELDEANNYIVLEFKTETEWDMAQDIFNLERVDTYDQNPNIRRHGIGRVIDGKKIMDRLQGVDDED